VKATRASTWVRRREKRERAGEEAERVAELVEELVALMEAGVTAEAAWGYLREFSAHPLAGLVGVGIAAGERTADAVARAAGAWAVEQRSGVTARSRSPADVSRTADASWTVLAAIWRVADVAGAPMVPALRRLADALRDRAETERDVHVALAGPRATAQLVSWLPVVGMLLAVVMGVDLVGTLTGSAVGWALLSIGVLLLVVGRRWMRTLLRRAHPGFDVPGLRHDLIATALTGGVGVPSALAMCDEACSALEVLGDDRAEVARILSLAQRAGAPAADLLRSAAARARRQRRTQGRTAAAALAVRSMLPLGACVLPSFMLLGVAPVVLSIVSSTVAAF
jgi:tight adherence protein B